MSSFDGYSAAVARLAAKKSRVTATTDTAPSCTYIDLAKPRPLSFYLVDGAVPEGFEASGKLFPFRVLDDPAQYLVIGEIHYSDGRRFLDFGMNPAWIEANTDYQFRGNRYPDYYCPDCDAKNGEHVKVTIPNANGIGLTTVKCPRDTRRSFGRGS